MLSLGWFGSQDGDNGCLPSACWAPESSRHQLCGFLCYLVNTMNSPMGIRLCCLLVKTNHLYCSYGTWLYVQNYSQLDIESLKLCFMQCHVTLKSGFLSSFRAVVKSYFVLWNDTKNLTKVKSSVDELFQWGHTEVILQCCFGIHSDPKLLHQNLLKAVPCSVTLLNYLTGFLSWCCFMRRAKGQFVEGKWQSRASLLRQLVRTHIIPTDLNCGCKGTWKWRKKDD